MKKVYVTYLCFFIAVLIGLVVYHDQGSVEIHYQQWLIETRLWFAALAILVFAMLFHLLLRFIRIITMGPQNLRQYFAGRRLKKQMARTKSGLIALGEGQWQLAEKRLLAGLSEQQGNTLINYLGAARAAQGKQDLVSRDRYLAKAQESDPDAAVTILFNQAELHIESGEYPAAYQAIKQLQSRVPHHPRLLKLSHLVLQALGETEALQSLLPQLRSQGLISEEDYARESRELLIEIMQQMTDVHTQQKTLTTFWRSLSRQQQHDPTIVAAYAKTLLQHNCANQAEDLLSQTLKRQYDDDLVDLFGQLQGGKPNRRLVFLEQCAKHQAANHHLLTAMGKQAKLLQLWGKSKSYFEQSINQQPSTQACLELGRLLKQLGMHEQAGQYFEKGLSLIEPSPKSDLKPLMSAKPGLLD